MNDSAGMHILERKRDLNDPVENFELSEDLALGLFPLNVVSQITNYTKDENDYSSRLKASYLHSTPSR